MLHGYRLLSANVRLTHAVLHITPRVTPNGEDTPPWAARAAAEAEAGGPHRQLDFSQAELSPDKPDFFTHDVASGRTPEMVQPAISRRISASTWGTVACQARRMVTLLCLARRPATSSERESLQDAFSTRFTGYRPWPAMSSATTLSTCTDNKTASPLLTVGSGRGFGVLSSLHKRVQPSGHQKRSVESRHVS